MQDFTPDMLRRETVRLALEQADAIKNPARRRRRQEQAVRLAALLNVPLDITVR